VSVSVNTAFIDQFASETKLAYQRMGSKLRGTVRTVMNVNANTYRFPNLGSGTANTKARQANVTPMNLAHTNVTATLSDYYAPEYIDVLDEFKTNESVRSDYAESAAAALGRQEDQLIIDALDATGNTVVNGGTNITLAKIQARSETFNENDVPQDDRYWVIAPNQVSTLLTLEAGTGNHFIYSNRDISNSTPLTSGTVIGQWMGFNWIMHSGLPLSGNIRSTFCYHKRAVGHAIGKDITASIDYIPEKVSHLVNAWLSMGSIIIDDVGVAQVDCDETA